VEFTRSGALPVLITPMLVLVMLVLTVVVCIAAALGAIFRVVRIDPVMVFTR